MSPMDRVKSIKFLTSRVREGASFRYGYKASKRQIESKLRCKHNTLRERVGPCLDVFENLPGAFQGTL